MDSRIAPSSRHNRPELPAVAAIVNCVFWLYFWIYFAFASQSTERALYMDHPLDPYIFWGHGIGVGMNPLILPFMKIMVCIQLPSFFIATLVQNIVTGEPLGRLLVGVLGHYGGPMVGGGYPNTSGGILLFGVSINGYRLLLTMALSFVQWILIAKAVRAVLHRCLSRTIAAPH